MTSSAMKDAIAGGKEKGEDCESVFDMVTMSPVEHRLGVDLKANILPPGRRKRGCGPRIKFFKGLDMDRCFVVSLDPDRDKIAVSKGDPSALVVVGEDLRTLLENVRKYRMPLLHMWYEPGMTHCEMLEEMRAVDKGEDLPCRKNATRGTTCS